MSNREYIRSQVVRWDFGKDPASVIELLRFYGLTLARIATRLDRAPNQISYYAAGTTQMPQEVRRDLHNLLVESRNHLEAAPDNRTMEGRALRQIILRATDRILETWDD